MREANRKLETFPNPTPERDYTICIECPEFTCVCPKTGQPDFAEIRVEYVPEATCVELKSLKLYFWSYRERGAFHEAVTNEILDDLVAACQPRRMTVTGKFNVRGGLYTTVTATYEGRREEEEGKRESEEGRGRLEGGNRKKEEGGGRSGV